MVQSQHPSFLGPYPSTASTGIASSTLMPWKHPSGTLADQMTNDQKGIVVAVSSRWTVNRRNPSDVGLDYRVDILPGSHADTKAVDQVRDRLTKLIGCNRYVFDKSLQLGAHHVANNSEWRTEALRKASKTAASALGYLNATAHTNPQAPTIKEPHFTFLDGAEFAHALAHPNEPTDLVMGKMDETAENTSMMQYLQCSDGILAGEFAAVGWDGPYTASPVTIYFASGRDPSKHHNQWQELCSKVGFPTKASLSEMDGMRTYRWTRNMPRSSDDGLLAGTLPGVSLGQWAAPASDALPQFSVTDPSNTTSVVHQQCSGPSRTDAHEGSWAMGEGNYHSNMVLGSQTLMSTGGSSAGNGAQGSRPKSPLEDLFPGYT